MKHGRSQICIFESLKKASRVSFLRWPLFYFFLLTARPWAERGSCSARDLLTARPWAERGSSSARDLLLLSARPWAERGSSSARDLLFFVV